MASKLDSMRPESASKLWASDSTIRTDVLLMAGKDFDDADPIDNDGNTEAGDDDEAAVPVARDAVTNESSVSLPMRLEDMSAELAAVLRRTGGVDDLRLRRTKSPVSTASYHSRQSTATRSERDARAQASRIPSAKEAPEASSVAASAVAASAVGSSAYRSAAARSSGTAATKHGSADNNSLSELDIVMGRTGGAIDSRSALSSRASAAPSDSVLRGGSGTPGSPVVANDSENELANVMRRTTGYVPSVSSLASSAASDNGRPTTAASDLKSVRAAAAAAATERPVSTAASSARGGTPSVANGHSSPQPHAPRTATPRASSLSPWPPAAGSIAASNRGSVNGGGAAAPPTYASSPLRGPAYQPSERNAPSAGMPPQQSNRSLRPAEAAVSRYQSPSPELYRLPTPVFGRFPSPPAHIKNRAKENYEQENGGGAQQQQQQQQRPEGSRQEQPGSSRYRPHSHSVGQRATTPEPADQYREEPVVDRLDLETGSLASRRGRQRQGS
ncbi:hypothetical protein GGI23_006947, partial [Coemansia sp. RSA 2559]